MKKLIPMLAAVALALACVLIMGACGTGDEAPPSESLPAAEPAAAQTSKATGSDLPEPAAPGKPLFYNGSYGSAATQEGYFDSFSWVSGWSNIMYTDYATATQRVLCNAEGCAHAGEACSGWRRQIWSINPVGDELLVAADGYYADYPNDFYPLRLEMVDPATGSARTLATIPEEMDRYDGDFAWDEDHAYLMLSTYTDDGQERKHMVRVALEDGRQETLFTLEGTHFLVGVMEDKFIIKKFTVKDEGTENESFFAELFAMPSSGQGEPVPLKSWGEKEMEAGVYGSELVCLKAGGEVMVCDLKTGAERTVGAMPPVGAESAVYYLHGWQDGHVLVDGWDAESDNYCRYVMDENGQVSRHGLTMTSQALGELRPLSYGGGPDPVNILADAGDQYLVLPAIDFFTGPKNDPYQVGIEVRRYALIDKADFWAGKPEYTMVDMSPRTALLVEAVRSI